jgi:D-arginine dehydrogenase
MLIACDFIVVGAGIAGAAAAANLVRYGSVLLVEMEDQPGYHSTGRSAALFSAAYGNDTIRALTQASRATFYDPPEGFCATSLVHPRNVLLLAREGQADDLQQLIEATDAVEPLQTISPNEANALCPIVRPDRIIGAALGRATADIEVHELHQAYLRQFKSGGGGIVLSRRVLDLSPEPGGWRVQTNKGEIRAGIVINAAGAWAGEIGCLAGASDIGMRQLKRTACLVAAPDGESIDKWPMVVNVNEEFYLKPDAGKLLLSPADETQSIPCDVQADELDIAIAIDRVEQATTLKVRRVEHRWAGLRSFVPDSSPVVGFDPIAKGFFWLAALGGYGIQTAPALGKIAASLAAGREVDSAIHDFDVNLHAISPGRTYGDFLSEHRIGVSRALHEE